MLKTLQVATVGDDTNTVLAGIKNVPTHKLALICLVSHEKQIEKFARKLSRTLEIDVEVFPIKNRVVEGVLEVVGRILRENSQEFEDVVLNVAGGEKALTCAAVSAAFFNGIKAFHLMDETPIMLPVLKMSYDEIVSDTKVRVLHSLRKADGIVESLTQLSEVSGFGKPLLSYHVNGAEDSRGLVELGLVETKRGRRGRLAVSITALGRAVLLGLSTNPTVE